MSTTSTVQLATIGRNDDHAVAQTLKTHIPLHSLCRNCTKVIDDIEAARLVEPSESPIFQLCTFAHLVIYHPLCHFCTFLCATLERNGKHHENFSDQSRIYIQLDHDQEVLNVGIADTMPEQVSGRVFVAAFELKKSSHLKGDAFGQHVIATSVPRYAQHNLERAKSWLETCLSDHDGCRGFHHDTVPYEERHRRPTRVLELSGTSIRLRCNMTYESFEYLALSHIWGDPKKEHLKLKLENIAMFKEEIPYHELSSIYKEAIRTTLALGYRYLWIDSLCIIQNSDSDWEHEANLMATVYGNAACNLAFLFADSISTPRSDPRIWNPVILRHATPSIPGLYVQHSTSLLRATYQNKEILDWLVQRHWPLFGRAWTFQEYLLCPRTLLLGHKNLMWQCSKFFYDELLGPIAEAPSTSTGKRGRDMRKSRYFPSSLSAGLGEDECMSSLGKLEFMIDWQALMNEYRSRNLTKARDRIVAFAGVARAFSNMGSLTYLAGSWAELFPLCLAWYVDKKSEAVVRRAGESLLRGGTVEYLIAVHEEVIHSVPSWSQFKVPIYTHHQTYFALNEDEVFIRSKSLERTPRECWDDIYWADLLSFTFPDQPPNKVPDLAYSNFTGLQVTIGLPIFPAKLRLLFPQISRMFDLIRASHDFDAEAQWKEDFTYYPDDPALPRSLPKRSVLALLHEFQVCRVAGEYNIQRRLGGLVLKRDEKEGSWTRVGAWKLKIKVCGVHVDAENVGNVAGRWSDYSVCEVGGGGWFLERVVLI